MSLYDREMGGDRSVLTWKYFDGERVRMYTLYVGQDGILADTAYYGRWNYVIPD